MPRPALPASPVRLYSPVQSSPIQSTKFPAGGIVHKKLFPSMRVPTPSPSLRAMLCHAMPCYAMPCKLCRCRCQTEKPPCFRHELTTATAKKRNEKDASKRTCSLGRAPPLSPALQLGPEPLLLLRPLLPITTLPLVLPALLPLRRRQPRRLRVGRIPRGAASASSSS